MSLPARSAVAVTLICLAACGSGGGGTQGSLTISPQTASATIGGPAVTLTASLSGSSNPIAWTLSGPGSIAPAQGSSTQYTPPPFGGTPATATVTASAGSGLSASVTVSVAVPASIDVHGMAIGSDTTPVAGVSVTIGTQSATTDAGGRFTISGVTVPYDLTAVATSPRRTGVVYEGLTRRDPTILMVGIASSPRRATLTGNVTGANPVGVAGDVTRLIIGSPQIPFWLVNDVETNVTSNPYTLHPSWVGQDTTTGTIHVLQWQQDGGLPVSYSGYASVPGITLSADAGTVASDAVLSAPPASTIAGTIQLAPSLTRFSQLVAIVFPGAVPTFLGSDTPTASFAYPFPNVAGATATLVASAGDTGSSSYSSAQLTGITPGTTNILVALPPAPTPVAPVDHTTGVGTTTDFTWTPVNGTVYVLLVIGPSAWYVVVTSATTARIPDLSAQGLGLSGKSSWNVNAYGPAGSVDELAGAALQHLLGTDSYFGGTTAPRDFTNP